jgi:hypothetical protein
MLALAERTVPSLRRVQREMHPGQPRARELQAHPGVLAG